MATKRSAKGTNITTRAGFLRNMWFSLWDNDQVSDALKDNPIRSTVLKDVIDHLASNIFKGLVTVSDSTFLVIHGGTITVNGSTYTVNEVGYALFGGEIYKINTGSDVIVDTIRLVLSSTEDGLYRTLDIEDGTSGSGVVDYADIVYLSDSFNIDISTETTTIEKIITNNVNFSYPLQVGNSYALSGTVPNGVPIGISSLSPTRVALGHYDGTNNKLGTYDFDGVDWSLTGNQLTLSANTSGMASLSSTRVAIIDTSGDLKTYDFDGTDWSQTGNTLDISAAVTGMICSMSSSRIAYYDSVDDDLRAYDFDGTDWSQVGNDLNFTGSGINAMCALSSTRVVLINNGEDTIQAYDFDGTDWAAIGNGLDLGNVGAFFSVDSLSSTRIAFVSNLSPDSIYVYDFINETDWMQNGNPVSVGNVNYCALCALGPTKVAFTEVSDGDLTTYQWIVDYENISPPGPVFS